LGAHRDALTQDISISLCKKPANERTQVRSGLGRRRITFVVFAWQREFTEPWPLACPSLSGRPNPRHAR